MRRIIRVVLLSAALGTAPSTVPAAFAFEVQSGGVTLSAQGVAMLANRLAARSDPLAAKSAEPAGPGTAAYPGTGAARNERTRDERMMEFMFGAQTKTNSKAASRAVSLDDLKAALNGRR